jgi:glycosyltransferase involved in cell wall biosynthesis
VSLLTYDKVGGIETFNKYFIEALMINNFEVKVISLHDKNSFGNVVACKSNLWVLLKELLRERKQTDVVIWGHINFLPVFYMLKLITSSKHILITHGVEVWYKLPIIKEYFLNKMDCIWAVSNFTKDKLMKVCNVEAEKIKVFPNCIKLKKKHESENPYFNDKFNILTILRLDESYKLQSIINILDAMKEINDENINFTIIGKGNRIEYIQKEIQRRGLSGQVYLKGFVDDTTPYLEYCDIFTLISDGEGFGIVYLEAMQFGKPCLSAKNCGSSDVVVDGYNGYSFEINDIKSLKEKIILLMNNPSLRKKLGTNGRNLLNEKFTFDHYVNNQNLFIKEIVKA